MFKLVLYWSIIRNGAAVREIRKDVVFMLYQFMLRYICLIILGKEIWA